MKIIILIGLMTLLLAGCTSNGWDDYFKERNAQLDAQFERSQEKWALWEQTNVSCIHEVCREKCDAPMAFNPFELYDYNKDGELDAFEIEVMNSAQDRKSDCMYDCAWDYDTGEWQYMDECRLTGGF